MRAAKVILALFLLWLLLFAWSFADFAMRPPTGDGFVRGINRLESFLAWQVGALLVAGLAFIAGRMQPTGLGRWARRLSLLPLLVTAALWVLVVAAGIALFLMEHSDAPLQ